MLERLEWQHIIYLSAVRGVSEFELELSFLPLNLLTTMSAPENENDELIDYEEEDTTVTTVPTATNGHGAAVTTTSTTAATDTDKEKKGYVGVHSTGFR
jgi:hypothetical protein